MRITVGIHADGGPEGVRDTLDYLRRNTGQSIDLILLADGFAASAFTGVDGVALSGTAERRGAPSCFNRLGLAAADADLLVFMEAGALVGPSWLERLLAALQSDPRYGLAGPSTNRSWNVQGAFPTVREADIVRAAATAASRFGDGWQFLEPLHCLADFCYAVRREVVQAIGGADVAYGFGPCWEMDYTVRAARAGFRAVWAQGSFVYRRPFTTRRLQDENRLFEASKRRYQDNFCGLRLIGERTAYARHCRGDTCPHFAPAGRIKLRLPLADDAPAAATRQPSATTSRSMSAPVRQPLITCIMPTRNRPDWMQQAIAYFQRQDYPERELIIVDDSDIDHSDELPADARIQYVHCKRRLSIGAKRNHAAGLARGAIIAHWDDDDWYSAGRLSAQVAPLLDGAADITGFSETRFFEMHRWKFWTCTPQLHQRLFVHDVHGGTLVYQRRVIEDLARYPDTSLAEDAVFLNSAVARGARLRKVAADELFLYIRHGENAWAFDCGAYLDARGWRRIEEPQVLSTDRAFYADHTEARAGSTFVRQPLDGVAMTTGRVVAVPSSASEKPLVSCIMPTNNRRLFVPKAIEYFLRQDYPNRELIILDDGEDRVADLVPDLPSLHYVALPQRLRLGTKRNTAIEASGGEIIFHWDDDDWMDPSRISCQVSALSSADADICGASSVWFCEIAGGRLSIYQYPPNQRRWLYGASLCYRRSLWQQKRFEPLDNGEDTRFVWTSPVGKMVDLDGRRIMIAMVHSRNTSRPQPLTGPHWHAWQGCSGQDMLGEDWPFYERLSRHRAAAS